MILFIAEFRVQSAHHKLKEPCAPWNKSYDKSRQYIKKQRHYFTDKGPYSQSYGFSGSHVWMWELDHKEGWPPKNWCFQLWCWRRLLRVPWTTKRSNQSILKENNPEYSWEGLMLNLQYSGHLMQTANSLAKPWCWQRLKVKGERGSRGWDD